MCVFLRATAAPFVPKNVPTNSKPPETTLASSVKAVATPIIKCVSTPATTTSQDKNVTVIASSSNPADYSIDNTSIPHYVSVRFLDEVPHTINATPKTLIPTPSPQKAVETPIPNDNSYRKITLPNGIKHWGIFKDGLLEDPMGIIMWPNGDYYSGAVSKGKMHGKGTLTFHNQDYVHGKPEGQTFYAGDLREGLFSGSGYIVFSDGSKYEGEFTGSRMEGKGVLTKKCGSIFEGIFKDNKMIALINFSKAQKIDIPSILNLLFQLTLKDRQDSKSSKT